MQLPLDKNVNTFNEDVDENQGYRYTTNAQLSSKMANERLTKASLAITDLSGKHVIDIGCGDGTYTFEIYDRGKIAHIHGVDPAEKAIEYAKSNVMDRQATFAVENAYALPYADNTYDVAYLRGVLHHMSYPEKAIGEALRVARRIVIIEPNGFNPVLKLLEKVSKYHIEHDEKSYFPFRIDQWIAGFNGRVVARKYVGLVPMFSPDLLARAVKVVEPLAESLPVIKHLGCACYVLAAESKAD
jgi:ubiquinone/menaquinone biosynthesis C-methylase UbiE